MKSHSLYFGMKIYDSCQFPQTLTDNERIIKTGKNESILLQINSDDKKQALC